MLLKMQDRIQLALSQWLIRYNVCLPSRYEIRYKQWKAIVIE